MANVGKCQKLQYLNRPLETVSKRESIPHRLTCLNNSNFTDLSVTLRNILRLKSLYKCMYRPTDVNIQYSTCGLCRESIIFNLEASRQTGSTYRTSSFQSQHSRMFSLEQLRPWWFFINVLSITLLILHASRQTMPPLSPI